MPVRSVRSRGVALAVLIAAAITAGGAAAATLSPVEHAFRKSFVKLVPTLNAATNAVIKDVRDSSHETDAQVARAFTAVARQWAAATKPLSSLKAPAPEATILAAIVHYSGAVEVDLLAAAKSGRTHSVSAANRAGLRLAHDFNTLGVWVGGLKKKLGLP